MGSVTCVSNATQPSSLDKTSSVKSGDRGEDVASFLRRTFSFLLEDGEVRMRVDALQRNVDWIKIPLDPFKPKFGGSIHSDCVCGTMIAKATTLLLLLVHRPILGRRRQRARLDKGQTSMLRRPNVHVTCVKHEKCGRGKSEGESEGGTERLRTNDDFTNIFIWGLREPCSSSFALFSLMTSNPHLVGFGGGRGFRT